MKDVLWEISKLFRLRFFYLATRTSVKRLTALYVLITGFLSLSLLGSVAYFLNWPLVFPSLGPTAFLIFYAPARPMSWPRNAILGHLSALAWGLIAHFLMLRFFPQEATNPVFDLIKTLSVSGAMAVTALCMVFFDLLHPPAASTAMLAAAGYLRTLPEALGFILALFLLTAVGYLFHRMAGIVYPLWRGSTRTEDLPIRTKIGEVGEASTEEDPYARLAHRLTTRRD